LTETKSWSEMPPELAIAGEEGGEVKAFRDLEKGPEGGVDVVAARIQVGPTREEWTI
jgi:hypothetical protein